MKTKIFLFLFFLLQTLCLKYNMLGVATQPHFERFAELTESMVYARLALTEQRGALSSGGLLIRFLCKEREEIIDYHLRTYLEGAEICEPIIPYKSRPNLQGFVFSGLDRISPLDKRSNITAFEWMVSLISAGCITWFLWWVFQAFSPITGVVVALSMLFSPWMTVSGGHLYWISGIFFLPFTFVAVFLHKQRMAKSLSRLFTLSALLFLLKSLVIGYELLTTSLVMCTIPVFYYAFRQKWTFITFFRYFSVVSGGLLVGLALSVCLLFAQMSFLEGNGKTGFAHLQDRLAVRTTGNAEQYLGNPNIKAAYEASLAETMDKYWWVALYRVPTPIRRPAIMRTLPVPTWIFLSAGLLFALIGVSIQQHRPLALTVLISLLAPMSWFVIFKAHSFLHPHLNPIGWFLPTATLMVLLIGELITSLGKGPFRKHTHR